MKAKEEKLFTLIELWLKEGIKGLFKEGIIPI